MTKQEIRQIEETTELQFKDANAKKNWKNFVEVNSANYASLGIINYASRWAKVMQKEIAVGNRVDEIAKKTSSYCDFENLSGLAFYFAVQLLSKTWKYGEELLNWHNDYYAPKAIKSV